MTHSSYLQQLIARMDLPLAGGAAVAAPLPPPETPPLPAYDPFAELPAADETFAPVSTQLSPPAGAPPAPPEPAPAAAARVATPAPERDRVVRWEPANEVIITPPEIPALPPPEAAAAPPTTTTSIVSPAAPVPMMQQAAAVAQVIQAWLAPPEPAAPLPASAAAPIQLPAEKETLERVLQADLPAPLMATAMSAPPPPEPLAAPEASQIALDLPRTQPRISIGEIVVEIVTKTDLPRSTLQAPAARTLRPSAAPARRGGVPSKQGFGLGQM